MASVLVSAPGFCYAAAPSLVFRVQSVVTSQTRIVCVGERGRDWKLGRRRRLERAWVVRGTGWGGSNFEVADPLDLTEENVEQVLLDARSELLQLFDVSVGITGVVQLVELDGPFVKVRLTGRFWHQRSMVLARVANYLQKRIPEIAEVEIEDEAQLDDSAANF